MSVMNRQMFQRTMPVRRQTGSPVSGETTVEDYIAKGFDPYEFEADQAMNQQPQQQSFLSKIFDSISDYFTFGRSDPESRLIIGGDYYDPDDPSFKSFIERNYQNEGESYIEGIENFKNEVEGVRNRQEGSPMQGETVDPENVGIMSGFKDDEGMASEILKEGETQQKAVDESADYVELMDAIRGNEQTEEQRRDELADVVGETDADKTPDSVLVLVQPVMQMLDATTRNEGIAQMDQGQMMMPPQPAGIGATDVVMRNTGSPYTGEISPLQKNFEDNYATYMSLMNKLSDPSQSRAALNFAAANRLLEFGSGQTADDSLKGFIGDINKIGVQEGAKQSQLKTQLAMAALTQAQKQQLQALKTEAEKTKKKKTFVTGLNKDRDRLIAALLGLYKDAPTGPRGNPMGEGGLETTRVIDFAKLYV